MKLRLVIMTTLIVNVLFGAYAWREHHQVESRAVFSQATLKLGSSGKDVVELQGRLKFLGFYKGSINGNFDATTRRAVTWFQWKFGLKSDGIVAGKTKLKLWEATKKYKPTATSTPAKVKAEAQTKAVTLPKSNRLGLTENEMKLIANAVYGEARGELYEGQVAVAAVILNRMKSPNFPHTVSGVIFQPGAFTAVADGQIWLTPNETAHQAVIDAANGWDPTGGCTFYFNPDTATSKWIWSRPQIKTIGKHIFCM